MSSSATPSTLPMSYFDAEKLSLGAVAAVAVACTVFGTLLGWLLGVFRHRQKHRAPESLDNGVEAGMCIGKEALSPALSSSSDFSCEPAPCLFPETPDHELSAHVQEIGILIQRHVETNYHLKHVEPKIGSLVQGLANLDTTRQSDLTSAEIINLVLDPHTRHVAIQHVISLVVFTSVDFSARSRLSMLPTPVASFLKAIPGDEPGECNTEVDAALARWRTLSAFLLHPDRSRGTPLVPSEAAIASQAMSVVSVMNAFLRPFARASREVGDKHRQARDLQTILLRSARLGYALLSHPCEWRFNHSSVVDGSPPTSGLLVVCSGLEKTSDRDGRLLAAPVQVVRPAVVKI